MVLSNLSRPFAALICLLSGVMAFAQAESSIVASSEITGSIQVVSVNQPDPNVAMAHIVLSPTIQSALPLIHFNWFHWAPGASFLPTDSAFYNQSAPPTWEIDIYGYGEHLFHFDAMDQATFIAGFRCTFNFAPPPPPNSPPVSNAGPDQGRECEGSLTSVTLDGTGSSDPDQGDVLTYLWSEGSTSLGSGALLDVALSRGHHLITLTVTDQAGSSSTDTVNIDISDTTPPDVTLLGDSVMSVTCGDAFVDPGATASDLCDGALPVAVSGSVNTGAIGQYAITYSATDSSDLTGTATRIVKVVYSWSGFLQPINTDGSSIFKLGSTVPVKFQLTGPCAGLNIVARLYVAQVSGAIVGTEMEGVSSAAADSGNQFRLSGGQYVFNLSTKGLSAGSWLLRADFGDGASHTVLVSLK